MCIRDSHNARNGLAAIAAANHIGIEPELACKALCSFLGVKRRMEKIFEVDGTTIYDDFAHHPTAISATLEGVRSNVGTEKIVAIIEPRSNTMKIGIHKNEIIEAIKLADEVLWYEPEEVSWSIQDTSDQSATKIHIFDDIDQLILRTLKSISGSTHIIIMSNGSFQGFHIKLINEIKKI